MLSAEAETRTDHAGMTMLMCWSPAGLISWDPDSLDEKKKTKRAKVAEVWEGLCRLLCRQGALSSPQQTPVMVPRCRGHTASPSSRGKALSWGSLAHAQTSR